jgi:Co/Zn/Cd efflux system component
VIVVVVVVRLMPARASTCNLKIVLAINAVMFVVMVAAAIYADSIALLSDSLDNLGDAITYGLSLAVVMLGVQAKAKVALFKGLLILLSAFVVMGQLVYKLINPTVPIFEFMGHLVCSA